MARFEKHSRDFYKILNVPRTASIKEIKESYRKLALRLHPDRHNNNPGLTAEFRQVTDAYAVLSDERKKNSYDFSIGLRYSRNRRAPPPPNYRSIKFPRKPKGWTSVWDHQKHYDMHYGDGMYKEVLEQVRRRARRESFDEYQSPIGKGFSFSKEDKSLNRNPYSRSSVPQGPRKIEFVYEEVDVNMDGSGRQTIHRQTRVVEDLHGRREQRRANQARQRAPRNRNTAFDSPDQSCVIL